MSNLPCCSKSAKSLLRKHPILGVLGIVVGAVAVYQIVAAAPDIVRYIKIKTM